MRRFREDENELPYLVYETRESKKRKYSDPPLNISYEDIPFSEFPSYVNRLILTPNQKSNLISAVDVKPRQCTFSIRQSDEGVQIKFKVKNQYLESNITVFYNPAYSSFESQSYTNYHNGLEALPWFKNEVARVEGEIDLKFWECGSGFDYECSNGKFLLDDSYTVIVFFGDESPTSDYHEYKVDFENKKLEKYHVTSFMEWFAYYI